MKIERKPEWLRKKANPGEQSEMRRMLTELRLNTVCQQALCPNISECFSCGQATFLILGRNCTRLCSFCNVEKHTPLPPEMDEPGRVAEAVSRLKLSHAVITSPTRDDLPDGGASHFAATAAAIRSTSPDTAIELLIPDFMGMTESLECVISSGPDTIAHNIETVPRLYHIRSGAVYLRSLEVLRRCAGNNRGIRTKSGIMLGMGENTEEVLDVMSDVRKTGCAYFSIGQYLAPGRKHHPVVEYIKPEMFDELRLKGLDMGFAHIESGPYIRSSYHAARYA